MVAVNTVLAKIRQLEVALKNCVPNHQYYNSLSIRHVFIVTAATTAILET